MLNSLVSNLTFGNVVPWLLLGVVSAFIVHLVDQREVRRELWITTIAGVFGALVGGVLSSLFIRVDPTGVNVTSFLFATLVGLLAALFERFINSSSQKAAEDEPRYDYESGKVAYYSQVAPLSDAEKLQYGAGKTYQPKIKHLAQPAEIEKYLAVINFPVTKTELIEQAEKLNANDDVLYTFEQLPDRQYFGAASLKQYIKQIE